MYVIPEFIAYISTENILQLLLILFFFYWRSEAIKTILVPFSDFDTTVLDVFIIV